MKLLVATALVIVSLGAVSVDIGRTADQAIQSVFVDAQVAGWTSTGVVLKDGQGATITAAGTAICNLNEVDACTTGPDGADPTTDQGGIAVGGDFLVPGVPRYSLVAQVGNADPVFIGTGPTRVSGPGEILLAYNDDDYGDNRGGYDATITVD